MTYAEQLRDPRWQRKRLEILQRDGWRCGVCGSDSTELHVHHRYYEKGRSPWEYESASLLSVCDQCHKDLELRRKDLIRAIGMLNPNSDYHVLGFIWALAALNTGEEIDLFCLSITDGVARALSTGRSTVISCSRDGRLDVQRLMDEVMSRDRPNAWAEDSYQETLA